MQDLPKDSMQARLNAAGIKTIYPEGNYCPVKDVQLEYNGKRIKRPYTESCVTDVKKAFGIDI